MNSRTLVLLNSEDFCDGKIAFLLEVWAMTKLLEAPRPNLDLPELQLDLFLDQPFSQTPYLYKISSLYSEDYDPAVAPVPTSSVDLPPLDAWVMRFASGVLEIWAGKRIPAQLIKWCHTKVYQELLTSIGYQKEVGRIRKIHLQEPLDGLCEATITVRFGERIRSMVLRFEGLDKKWLCTEMDLI
jgi:hypothetical protein